MTLVYISFSQLGKSVCLWVNPLSWVMSLLWFFQRIHCPMPYCVPPHWVNAAKSFVVLPDVQREVRSLPLQLKHPLCQYLLSQSNGYIIYNIPKLCFEFCVVDVGFIMALLPWDYSCWHHLIIHELVLETSLVPWDLYALMTDSLAINKGSHHWPLIGRLCWMFDTKTSIRIQ